MLGMKPTASTWAQHVFSLFLHIVIHNCINISSELGLKSARIKGCFLFLLFVPIVSIVVWRQLIPAEVYLLGPTPFPQWFQLPKLGTESDTHLM